VYKFCFLFDDLVILIENTFKKYNQFIFVILAFVLLSSVTSDLRAPISACSAPCTYPINAEPEATGRKYRFWSFRYDPTRSGTAAYQLCWRVLNQLYQLGSRKYKHAIIWTDYDFTREVFSCFD